MENQNGLHYAFHPIHTFTLIIEILKTHGELEWLKNWFRKAYLHVAKIKDCVVCSQEHISQNPAGICEHISWVYKFRVIGAWRHNLWRRTRGGHLGEAHLEQ